LEVVRYMVVRDVSVLARIPWLSILTTRTKPSLPPNQWTLNPRSSGSCVPSSLTS
jgi:hypothetical protein